ncbi:phage holin family protein [Nissabacter sp. SGAir0207]|uniref:phage holin family protein n=1 Tax=Nissabacter sp. SGAir0207 TaxID=2126321 RepID=UPI0010F685FA|nr:phage holin family protein [Nissabacter sp. SGAir0207]
MTVTTVENFAFMEFELFLTIIVMATWGGVIRILLQPGKLPKKNRISNCIMQVCISCFTGFILSVLGIERGLSPHMVIMVAGLGGVFSGTLLTALGERISSIVQGRTLLTK